MAAHGHLSTAPENQLWVESGQEHYMDVLREVLNESFEGNDEASVRHTKSGINPLGSPSSRKKNQRRSTSRIVNTQQSESQPIRTQHKRHSNQCELPLNVYSRPIVPELVRSHIPSCSSPLPQNWSSTHDRFIAYLATHAPLTENGKVPDREEFRNAAEIIKMVKERFPRLGGQRLKADVIEMRLALLDQAGDNDYFDISYGAYNSEEWGCGI